MRFPRTAVKIIFWTNMVRQAFVYASCELLLMCRVSLTPLPCHIGERYLKWFAPTIVELSLTNPPANILLCLRKFIQSRKHEFGGLTYGDLYP